MSFYEIPGEQFCKENITGDGKTIKALPNLGMEIPLCLKDIVMYLLHGHFRDLVRFGQIFPCLRGLPKCPPDIFHVYLFIKSLT